MSAPFFKYGLFGAEFGLIMAFVIGIAFGFVLERAGFGSARKLTGQFYFTDMAVFKVMFTAIVTALLGLFYLSWMGMLDVSLIYLSPTRLPSQVLGGLILGVGFVVGGYCPGTSVVAVSTGKIDAMVWVGGLLAGIFAFGEMYPYITNFFFSGDMGKVTLADIFHVRYGLIVFAVVVMALVGFYVAEVVEKMMARRAVGS
jgi:hypothetical protein